MATVVITGASRGVGLALVKAYQARGDEVVAVVRQPGKAAGLAALPKNRLTVLGADVVDEAALAGAAKALGSRSVDILICNAGVMSDRGGILDPGHSAAEWQRVLATNVTGVFLTIRAFLPAMQRTKGGRIAIISSQMGSSALAGGNSLAYRVSKAGAANLGLNVSIDLRSKGIAVGIYHPGWVSTDMGGAGAPVTPAQSANGLVQRIDKLSLATTGVFEDHLGKPFVF